MEYKTLTRAKTVKVLGITAHVLKGWESEFEAFLNIPRDENNTRIYSEKTIKTLQTIKEMKEKHVDKETIEKILQMQLMNREKEERMEKELGYSYQMRESLNKMETFIESEKVKNLLNIENRFFQLEKNVVGQVQEMFRGELEAAATAQVRFQKAEFEEIGDKLCDLVDTSEKERAYYQAEINYEREIAKQQIAQREEKFIAFVKDQARKKEEKEMKKESKWGLNLFKQFIGVAK
ncbi:MerR family transcriptional regulator [Metabacillus arenae]|uniref:MerR family transcriptional regulator n=1 Tax=Metabacillus arenae TaxID=2771434 RepID=A0A926NFI1_9BACI|nr:MerR family transcriptional regulator [Metabacillus arenae]MBD1380321.1 MerR family transcriptional regulator [Metabacillus arenae]